MTVGEKICSRRKELGMTMEDLANKIGVKRWTVNKYEKDQIDMPLSMIRAIHDVLGISYMDLLDDDTSEEKEITTAYQRSSPEKQEIIRDILRIPNKN